MLVPLVLSLAALIWILFYPARWLVRLASRTSPGVVFFVRTERPWVSLTFDDGPDEEVTPAVLQILKREGVPATWFIIGERAERHPAQLRSIRKGGHELGNHFWTDSPTWLMSAERFQVDLNRTERLLAQGPPRLMRPASGWIRGSQIRSAASDRYTVVLGSAYCSDWLGPPDPYISWAMVRMCQPGAILILHVGPGRDRTPRVLPSVIVGVRSRGLEFVPLRSLLGEGRQGLASLLLRGLDT